jgi:nucleoside-diphosphate-sugar epimerase
VRYDSDQPGDARHTHADCTAAHETLGFEPKVGLEAGLAAQVRWATEEATP